MEYSWMNNHMCIVDIELKMYIQIIIDFVVCFIFMKRIFYSYSSTEIWSIVFLLLLSKMEAQKNQGYVTFYILYRLIRHSATHDSYHLITCYQYIQLIGTKSKYEGKKNTFSDCILSFWLKIIFSLLFSSMQRCLYLHRKSNMSSCHHMFFK
jgi:hypothetical protein